MARSRARLGLGLCEVVLAYPLPFSSKLVHFTNILRNVIFLLDEKKFSYINCKSSALMSRLEIYFVTLLVMIVGKLTFGFL